MTLSAWVIDTGTEHFLLGLFCGLILSGWALTMYGLWVTSRPPSKRRERREVERKKAERRGIQAGLIEAGLIAVADYEKEFGVITEQEMHEIEEEFT